MEEVGILSQIHGEKCWPSVDMLSPCEDACPIHMDVPSYVVAISQGKFKEALAVIRKTNPLPSVCGRVCHHPCEGDCTRALIDKPVAIQWLKRFAADYGLRDGEKPAPVERTKKERVAIIGSGPAGLAAAYDLVRSGYGATVYEAMPIPGGMLAQGIPQFCLSPEAVQADIDYLRALGVAIKTNIALGKDLTLEDLWREGFNAILLASGASGSPRLGISGEDTRGVISALPFLRDARMGRAEPLSGKVVVIGGGNVGIDAARAALRLGAQDVHIACLESSREMPAFAWEIENARTEGVRVHPSLAPQHIRTDAWGRVAGVDFRRVATFQRDAQGRISWTTMEGPGSEYALDANAVIVAIGQVPDPSYLGGNGRVNIDPRGAFIVDPETLATSVPGIFAAGDSVSAPGTVVGAMAAGQNAAVCIERYLLGQDLKEGRVAPSKNVFRLEDVAKTPRFMPKRGRWSMPSIPMEDRVRSFGEVNLGYTAWQAVEEAKRCLNCRMCGNCIFEKDQVCFETSRRLL